ncbi:MAG: D-xylose ABC transporter substrate-binding protein [Firmicutes bacterium]|nr:D-xylose ABC transporter substrate-binding protein [Bacillota bacterium]
MKNLRIFLIVGLLVVLVSSSLVTAAPKKIKIGFSLATLQEERWAKDRDFFKAEAERLGAQVLVQAANNDDALQISQCENLLSQGVDVLVIVPHDGEACAAAVESAHKSNVPVIAYDRLISNCDLDLYISFDNEKVGYLQAMGVLSKVSAGNFVYIGGSPTDNNAYLVKKGSMKALQPYIDQGKIKIVYDQFTPNWDPAIAQANMENALTMLNNQVDAVVAANDGTAGGVIQALADQKLAGKVPVSGQDADLAACQRIVEGTQTVTVYKPIKAIATAAAQAAIKLAKGEKVEAELSVNNGKVDVPYLALEPIPVYKENMYDVIIRDGFYTVEEVYRNIPKKDWPADK